MNLPLPSQDELTHQQPLLALLEARVQKGQLTFAEFMNIALYTPGLGYYSAGKYKIGAAGDFVTAPEISSLFSQCVGAQCAQILDQCSDACILELGAGSGRMAADIILYLSEIKKLPTHYFILEVSADLKSRQQDYLKINCPEYFEKIIWLDTLPATPISGIILANEVLDAMPVNLFQVTTDGEILEGFVGKINQQWQCEFHEVITPGLKEAIEALEITGPYTSEINLGLKPFLHSLSDILKQGVILLIDYGFPQQEYYHPSRSMGTLMCHYHHYAHADPLYAIGLQDMTAHVDFSALTQAAYESGLELAGFTHQAGFLLANGLVEFAQSDNTLTQLAHSQQIQKLTHPHEMGELFKVIAFSRDFAEPLNGFALMDRSHRL